MIRADFLLGQALIIGAGAALLLGQSAAAERRRRQEEDEDTGREGRTMMMTLMTV